MLAIGRQLCDRGWDVSYLFAPPRHGWRGRVDRQLTYFRVLNASLRARPNVSIVSSGDGVLLGLLTPRWPLIVQSHGLEHMCREVCAEVGVRDLRFGVGHRWIREPAVAVAARRADAFVAKTAEEANYAVEQLGVPSIRVHCIPNGVEDEFLTMVRRPSPRPTVIWIGTWIDRKGRSYLPDILSGLLALVPEAILHLVGTRASDAEVRSSFPRDVWSNLEVTAFTDRAGVQAACAHAVAGLFTSYYEGFGKAVVEMMAVGLPLVSTPAGVARTLVKDGQTGFRFSPGDASGAARALARILLDPTLADQLGTAARRTASAYRWEFVGDAWVSLLDEVLAARRHASHGRKIFIPPRRI